MSLDPLRQAELRDLIDAVCENEAASSSLDQLESLLLADDDACRYYLDYSALHGAMTLAGEQGNEKPEREGLAAKGSCLGLPMAGGQFATANDPLIPPPAFAFSGSSFCSPVSGILFSYLVAAFVLGAGLLVASVLKVSDIERIALAPSRQADESVQTVAAGEKRVGRITGMVDCRWETTGNRGKRSRESENNLPSPGRRLEGLVGGRGARGEGGLQLHSAVHLNDHFVLRSGVLELTYDIGAKVILQGPVTYNVDSAAGGHLSVGKMTARMEKKSESPENPKSPSLSPLPSPLFTITTPTAIVTDLGTEFGVEVTESGITEAHVFLGKIEVRRHNALGRTIETIQLTKNQAVHFDAASSPTVRLPANRERFVTVAPKEEPLGLVARYKFDEIANQFVLRTPDTSGRHRPGSLMEMTEANLVPGKVGKALEFNVAKDASRQRVLVPWSPAFDLVAKPFTLALWLNRRGVGAEEHETILHKEGSGIGMAGGYSIMRDRKIGTSYVSRQDNRRCNRTCCDECFGR